jgi:hypothetical protein
LAGKPDADGIQKRIAWAINREVGTTAYSETGRTWHRASAPVAVCYCGEFLFLSTAQLANDIECVEECFAFFRAASSDCFEIASG